VAFAPLKAVTMALTALRNYIPIGPPVTATRAASRIRRGSKRVASAARATGAKAANLRAENPMLFYGGLALVLVLLGPMLLPLLGGLIL